MSNWQTVFRSTNLHQAEIVKSVLKDRGIETFLLNKKDSSYIIGEIEVMAQPDDVIPALKVINDEIKF